MPKHRKKYRLNYRKIFFTILILIIIIASIVLLLKNKKTANNIIYSNEQETAELNNITEDNTITVAIDDTNKVENSIKSQENTKSNLKSLPVLMYHFFYDKTKSKGADNNWIEVSDFDAQMKYLEDNNFYYPSWQEVEDYIDGKITLPDKSVVITVDDGDPSFFKLAIPIIEKHNAKATSFVITSWYMDYCDNYKSNNVTYESHSDNMHVGGKNGKGVMLSLAESKILADVKLSSEKLNGADIFCYPFGQYNDLDKKVLKKAGYKLAFTTKGGRVKKGSDKYALPRVRTSKGMSLKSFAQSIS